MTFAWSKLPSPLDLIIDKDLKLVDARATVDDALVVVPDFDPSNLNSLIKTIFKEDSLILTSQRPHP